MFTLQSGNSAAYALGIFPNGAEIQQLSPSLETQFPKVFSKSDFPKTQIE